MVYFFSSAFLISLLFLAIGIMKPQFLFPQKNIGRKKAGVFFGSVATMLLLLAAATASTPERQILSENKSQVPTHSPKASVVPSEKPPHSPTARHTSVRVKVINVVDGDTVQIETGETVRYIGIDTPETVDPNRQVMCYGKEASDRNTQLVEGKYVELEKDISEKDRYGRLLRYIWLGDTLINELLVREGYAHSSSYPPDIKYQNRFVEAQRLAREERKGLWSNVCDIAPSPVPFNTGTTLGGTTQPTIGNGSFSCNCAKPCSQMSSCEEAQYQLNTCGCSKRDGDGDGLACDSDCR